MTYLPRANEPVEPHVHERAADGTWGCPTCIAEEAAAGGGGGGTGPAGPVGPAGPAGPAGPKGDTGAAGAKGATGPAGPAGAKGDTGAAGTAGATGPQGVPGVNGAVGPAGAKGDPGVQGEQGIQGIQGEQGIPGMGVTFKGSLPTTDDLPDGAAQGDLYLVETPAPAHGWVWDVAENSYVDAGPMQGPQGIEGAQGNAGPAGPAGADGVAGPQGIPGVDGAVGPVGPQGPAGADGTGTTYTLPISTSTVLGGVKVGAGLAVTADGTVSTAAVTGFLPLAGGTMTGTITVPTAVNAMTFGTSGYGVLGGTGGVAMRSGSTNITTFTGANVTYGVQLVTANTATSVRFGSAGPTLGVSGTTIAASAPITVAAAPVADTELANKAYVDSKAGTGGGSTVTNPVAGSVANMVLWTGTQAAYDAIATKSNITVYHITG